MFRDEARHQRSNGGQAEHYRATHPNEPLRLGLNEFDRLLRGLGLGEHGKAVPIIDLPDR